MDRQKKLMEKESSTFIYSHATFIVIIQHGRSVKHGNESL